MMNGNVLLFKDWFLNIKYFYHLMGFFEQLGGKPLNDYLEATNTPLHDSNFHDMSYIKQIKCLK